MAQESADYGDVGFLSVDVLLGKSKAQSTSRGNKTTKHNANKHFTSMESESPSELVDGLLAVNPCV